MGIIGGEIGYRLLRRLAPGGEGVTHAMDSSAYKECSKLETLLGKNFWLDISGKTVIDFGCGAGEEAVEMAKRGARMVYGLDIQEKWIKKAQDCAESEGVEGRCSFGLTTSVPADVIVAIDSFEHFDDPAAVLEQMATMLKPDGEVVACFGPTWYHPLGGHLFSVFPWAHLIFTEASLMRWRSEFKSDGARKFHEVDGGLNQMTLRRFREIVRNSPLEFSRFEAVPIKSLRWLANSITEEFTTAVVRCRLVRRRTKAFVNHSCESRAKAA